MAVIMTAEAPGADASFIDGTHASGVADTLAQAPGFVSHISGAASSGYRIEVSRVPGGPPGLVRRPRRAEPTGRHGPIPFEYVEMLLAAVPES
jgi:hypothetical protein